MKIFSNNKAFSLTEMLISLIVAAILILTIGVISSISIGSYANLTKEAQIYNDISYGFKLMQNLVRSTQTTRLIPPSTRPSWASNSATWIKLMTIDSDTKAFCLHRETTGSARRQFVYIPDTSATINCSTQNNCEVIFEVLDPNNSSLNLDVTLTAPSAKAITAQITGTKNNIPFNMATTILRRAQ